MPNLLDGCPIDDGADYTFVGAQTLHSSGSLVSSLQYVLFSVLFTIPLQLSNTAPLLSAVEVILQQHNCHLTTFNIIVKVML